jgi:hypothetical protein
MFQEIVSQISFSPAMVERLSVYAHTIKRRQRISGWSLVVVSILFIMQVVVTLLPAPTISHESTSQASDNFVSELYDGSSATSDSSMVSWLNTFASEIPSLGNPVVIGIYGLLFIVNGLTYLSLRLRSKEIRIIRTQLNTGGI